MKGSFVYLLISHIIVDWMALSQHYFGVGFFYNIFEGSVNHIIYVDYIVNQNSFISCSLA